MGWYGDSVHDMPDKFGLKLVYEIDTAGGYEYNSSAVWQREADGRFFYGHTSGCSCTVPWEEFTAPDDLTPVESLVGLHRTLAADHDNGAGATTRVCEMLERCAEAGLR